jgi:hypothetical protein
MEQVGWQVLLNFIAVYVIRFSETSQWGFLKKICEDYVWFRRGVILVFSTITAAGLVFHYEIKTGDFVLSGNFWSMLHASKHIGQNYFGIQGMYWVKTVYDSMVELRPTMKALAKQNSLPKTP